MLKKSSWLTVITIIVFGITLTACGPSWQYVRPAPTGFTGNCLSTQQTLVDQIESSGRVQIIQMGDNVTLVLPSDRFFEAGTPQLNTNYYPVLNKIAALLNGFDKFSIKVAGYTDNQGGRLRNIGLSRAQAEAIANYLWKRGVDARLMSSVGYGDQMPIASNAIPAGQAQNRRIEITLRLITDPDDM